jgi:hypothetical protein
MVMISCGIFLHCSCQVLTRRSLSSSQAEMMMIFSTLHRHSSFSFGSKLRRVWFRMIAPAALHSSTQLTDLCMPMPLQHSSCVSQSTRPHLIIGTFNPTYASWAWLIKSTLTLVHVYMQLFHVFVELLALWLTRCQSRDFCLLLALLPAIITVHLIGKAEALDYAHQATTPVCREVVAAIARLRHVNVMHVRIRMLERTSPKKKINSC